MKNEGNKNHVLILIQTYLKKLPQDHVINRGRAGASVSSSAETSAQS